MPFTPPYTVTVNNTNGGLANCSYVDSDGQPLPDGTVLTTTTPEGEAGSLAINFVEANVGGQNLRLVGAVVKTVGNDPTMNPYNYLYGTRTQIGLTWRDEIDVPWGVDMYTRRGVVLVFAQVDANGNMVNFFPSADPQAQNDEN
jgi:hypothetical protein